MLRLPNVGFAAGNNAVLAPARGRHVLLLNPDMEITAARSPSSWRRWTRGPRSGSSSVIQAWPEGGVQPTIRRFPSPGRQLSEALMLPRLPGLRAVQEEEQRLGAYDEEVSCDWLVGGFLLVRRDAIEQVGGLDERFFLFSEEADWCLRLREGGWDIRHLPAHDRHPPHRALRAARTCSPRTPSPSCSTRASTSARRAGSPSTSRSSLRHAVRLALLAPQIALRPAVRVRARAERQALSVVLGLDAPPFSPVP